MKTICTNLDKYIAWKTAYAGARIACVCNKGAINIAINNKRLASFVLRESEFLNFLILPQNRCIPINRSNIWKMMKKLCKDANVQESKVFPHNLRHLFARTYYKLEKDISRLADILGHANINTTRIYTVESGTYHNPPHSTSPL